MMCPPEYQRRNEENRRQISASSHVVQSFRYKGKNTYAPTVGRKLCPRLSNIMGTMILPGILLSRYEIRSEPGEGGAGGMGEVYLAKTQGSNAKWRSRSCRRKLRRMVIAWSVSSGKRKLRRR